MHSQQPNKKKRRGFFARKPEEKIRANRWRSLSSDLPEWMQSALKDRDPKVRLKALEKWIEQNQIGVGPAMPVINDPDERVRAKAMQVIERAWASE